MEESNENRKPNCRAQSEITQGITLRFMECVDSLVQTGAIRNKTYFPEHYGINRRNYEEVWKRFPTYRAQLDWLVYLIRDYHVSARWLMTGEGPRFTRKPAIVRKPKPEPGPKRPVGRPRKKPEE